MWDRGGSLWGVRAGERETGWVAVLLCNLCVCHNEFRELNFGGLFEEQVLIAWLKVARSCFIRSNRLTDGDVIDVNSI